MTERWLMVERSNGHRLSHKVRDFDEAIHYAAWLSEPGDTFSVVSDPRA